MALNTKHTNNGPLFFPSLPERLAGLEELAENLWWSWNPGARMLFKTLDRLAWKESGHNPDKLLRQLPQTLMKKAADDTAYLLWYDAVMETFHNYMTTKECSDLYLPLVAVGFMYLDGYFRQQIREDGWQENYVEAINREVAPVSRVMDKPGRQQMVIRVPLTDPPIYMAVWKVDVGRVPLYLMDTDLEINDPWNRSITARLYTGDLEQRLRQEIILGLGGAQMLKTLGIDHYILHLNEGHAAFALLERIRAMVSECFEQTPCESFTKNVAEPVAGHAGGSGSHRLCHQRYPCAHVDRT